MAIVLAIGAAAMLIIYQGLVGVNRAMQQLADIKEPIHTAAHEMEINISEVSMRVLRYLAAPSPRIRQRIKNDEQDFERFHSLLVSNPLKRYLINSRCFPIFIAMLMAG
jgi:hypothetical protein